METVNSGTAYLLWFFCFFGICGVQRFYTNRPISGLIYLLTFGLFGIGQLIDLILIPGLVADRNAVLQQQTIRHLVAHELDRSGQSSVPTVTPMQKLLQAAKHHQGQLSIAQAAIYTELEPEQVKELLLEAVRIGCAEITNDPQTGAIRYYFDI